jgi:hypothetical protein
MELPDEVLYELLDYRNALAHYFYKRQGYRYPLEEYISAGNLGIAEGVALYNTDKGEILPYVKMRIQSRIRKVIALENKLGNKIKLILHPALHNTGYSRRYLREIYSYIHKNFIPRDIEYFNKWLYDGGVSTNTQNVVVHKIRKSVREFDNLRGVR